MGEGGTIKLIFQIGSILLPIFGALIFYIYNRQLKTIFHQFKEIAKDIDDNCEDIKALYSKSNKNEVSLAIQGEKINNIEELCKIKHKE